MSKLMLTTNVRRLFLDNVRRSLTKSTSLGLSKTPKYNAAALAVAKSRKDELCRDCMMTNHAALFGGGSIPCMGLVPWGAVPSWSQYSEQESLSSYHDSLFEADPQLNNKIGFWSIQLQYLVDHLPVSSDNAAIERIGPYDLSPGQLTSKYREAIETAVEKGHKTLAIPCISSKLFGYSALRETFLALNTIRNWLEEEGNAEKVNKVICVVLDDNDVQSYEQIVMKCFPV